MAAPSRLFPLPTRQNLGIPDDPPRYILPGKIGLAPLLARVLPHPASSLAMLAEMYAQLYEDEIPSPKTTQLLTRLLRSLKQYNRGMWANLRRFGKAAASAQNRSKTQQLGDLLRLGLLTENDSHDYYKAVMARHQGSPAFLNYLPYYEFLWVVMRIQRDLFGAPPPSF